MRSEEFINSCNHDLIRQSLDGIYETGYANSAYETFLKMFSTLYDKKWPLREWNSKRNHASCLWITKGLQNARKKKNTLYRKFVRVKKIEAEIRYKNYKNKLSSIIRTNKKDYYKKLRK